MKYLLLVYGNERACEGPDWEACFRESLQLAQQLQETGQYLSGSALQPTSTATSVRVRDGQRMVTDGPFAETREQLGGYYLVDAENLDVAIRIAAQVPGARWGTVEIRPVLSLDGLPEPSDRPARSGRTKPCCDCGCV